MGRDLWKKKIEDKGVYFQPVEKDTVGFERRKKSPIVFQPISDNSDIISPHNKSLCASSKRRRTRSPSLTRARRDSFGRVLESDDKIKLYSRLDEQSRSRLRDHRKRKKSRSRNKSQPRDRLTPCTRDNLKLYATKGRKGKSQSRDRPQKDSSLAPFTHVITKSRGRSRSKDRTIPRSSGRSRSAREKSNPRIRGRSRSEKDLSVPRSRVKPIKYSRDRKVRKRERSLSRIAKDVRQERRIREKRRAHTAKRRKKKNQKMKRFYHRSYELYPKLPTVRKSRIEPQTESDDDPAKFDSMLNEYLFADKD